MNEYKEELQEIITKIHSLIYMKWNVVERNTLIEAKNLIKSLL